MAENLVRNIFIIENKIRCNLMIYMIYLKINIILPWTVKYLVDRLF